MYCKQCGRQLTGRERFCPQCGQAARATKPSGPDGLAYASFWRRAAAFLIDSLVMIAAGLALGTAFAAGAGQTMTMGLGAQVVLDLSLFTMQWLYYALMESSELQASLGKQVMRILVTDMSGRRITFLKATERYFAKMFSGLTLLAGYIMAGFTRKRQALHDMIVGTLVVNA